MKLRQNQIYQMAFTILSIVITIVIPIINYFNFKNSVRSFNCPDCPESLVNQLDLGDLEFVYDTLIYVFVSIGIIISVCTYFVHAFQKYSVQRGITILLISIVYLINSIFSAQMSTILVGVANIQIIMDSSGVYILFITITALYMIKAIFDLIDFKVNQSYYINILRSRQEVRFKQKKWRK